MKNKRHKHRLPATTLLELLIVMAAGSIVFASAAKCYEIVFKQTTIIKGVLNTLEEAQRFHYILERDVFHASSILQNGEKELSMETDSTRIVYQFKDSVVIRQLPVRVDTFHVVSKKPEVTALVLEGYPAEQAPLIEKLNLELKVLGKEEHFRFRKNYSTETLLNLMTEEKP